MPRPRRTPAAPPLPPRPVDFEIVIYDQPRYVPHQAPPQPPISLVLPRDTDAFIVEKVVTPFDVAPEDEQTVRRVLNYVVGWPDDPYARYLVPCTKILDYVSPRELEDWEYARTLREHAQKEAAAASAANRRSTYDQKRANGLVHGAEGAAEPNDTELPQIAGQKRKRGPGPNGRKRRGRKPKTQDGGPQPPTEPAAQAAARPPSAHLIVQGIPALAASKQRTGLSLTQSYQPPVQDKPLVESSNDEGTEEMAESDAVSHQANDHSVVRLGGDSGGEASDAGGAAMLRARPQSEGWSSATTETEDETKPNAEIHSNGIRDHETPTPKAKPTPNGFTAKNQETPKPAKRITYVPPPSLPSLRPLPPQATHLPRFTPVSPPKVVGMSSRPAKTQRGMQAPLPPNQAKHQEVQLETADNMAEDEDDEDNLYEVDRVEGDTLSVIQDGDGPERVVRFYLVRWKGNWPPDQNPTWEPAENLPPQIVHQYLEMISRKAAQ